MILLLIAAGGFIGAVARYGMAGRIHRRTGTGFPWGTLAVNVVGSFALGLLLPLLATDTALTVPRALLTVGVISSFTTFSSFAYETVLLLDRRRGLRATIYVGVSIGLGLGALVLGLMLSPGPR
jgi:fluoride exporter